MAVEHKTMPVTPHLAVAGAKAAIEFYKQAFGAAELVRVDAEDGERLMHVAMKLNGGVVMLHDDFPEYLDGRKSTPDALGGTPVTLHLTLSEPVEVDAMFARATKAGAKSVMEPEDAFWGDRYAVVADPFGHRWSIGAPLRR